MRYAKCSYSSLLVSGVLFFSQQALAGGARIDFVNASGNSAAPHSACGSQSAVRYEGESVDVRVSVNGMASSDLRYTYSWTSDGFQVDPGSDLSEDSNSSSFRFKIPKLAGGTDGSTILFSVSVVDSAGNEARAFEPLRVSRPYLLKLNVGGERCYNILPAEQISGIYTNDSSVSRVITIEDSNATTAVSETGWKKGFFFSVFPTFMGFGLIGFGWDKSYMTNKGRSVETRHTTSITSEILPEEAAVFFRQLTLLKNHYNIVSVDRCGKETLAGHGFFHNWVTTYPIALVDVDSPDPLRGIKTGVSPVETCPGFEEKISGLAKGVGIFYPVN